MNEEHTSTSHANWRMQQGLALLFYAHWPPERNYRHRLVGENSFHIA